MQQFDDDRVLSVAEAIADGHNVEWSEVDASPDAHDSAAVFRELKVLAALASVHRAAGLDTIETPPAGPPVPPAEPPREWGPFRIIDELGRGTFGAVYRARDARLDRDVALKLYFPRLGASAASLVSEGRVLARVRHPNVLTVYGADEHDGVAGIWMELLDGRTLQQELDGRGPLGAREAALIGIDLCHALAAVHRAGLVHRDVKAQNVMREAGGRIVLADFGAGRDVEAQPGQGTFAGTPLYMAPEVLTGEPATPSSDLYSLGVLLYRLVTNDLPVSAHTIDELRAAHASGTRRRLRDVRPDLPATFIRAVEAATEPDPAARTLTAAALEADLQSVLFESGSRPGGSRRAAPGRRRLLAAAGVAVVAAALGLWNADGIRRLVAPAPAGIHSIVVLPFVNLTGQPDQEYLSDGVTQVLIGNLAQLRSLRVISRTSAMSYKNTAKPLTVIARELDVDAVVEGSVARSGDRLRVTVQLLRANDEHLWGQTYERPTADLFKLQGEISGMIADAVRLSLTPEERRSLADTPGIGVQAQDALFRGMMRLNDLRASSLQRALADLLEAVRLDPGSARAYAALSQCYLLLGTRDVLSHDESYTNALQAATRALQLNDAVAEAHTQLAEVKFYYEWNWQEARREYERALELDPNNSHAMARYSLYLSALGQADEAVRWASLAQRLDPHSPAVRFAPGMAMIYARRYDEAIAAFLHLAELPPYSLGATDRVGLARAYAARGRYDEAVEQIGQVIRQGGPLGSWTAELGRIHAQAGHTDVARRILRDLESREDGGDLPAQAAFIHVALGEHDAAFTTLAHAADLRSPALLWIHVDPRLDAVRGDPRYAELAARVGRPH